MWRKVVVCEPFSDDGDGESLASFLRRSATRECCRWMQTHRVERFQRSIFVEFSSEESAKKVSGMSSTLVYERGVDVDV